MNRFGPAHRVLLVVPNPSVSTTLGWPVGFWASELTHAWYEFSEAGYETLIASPAGGIVTLDALSDPRDASGYSAHDILSMGFLGTPSLAALLDATPPIGGFSPSDFSALCIAGGQSPMFTFRQHSGLQKLIRAFWDAGKVVCAVCHGTAALLELKLGNGTFLIAGRHMTAFANSEEDYADQVVGKKVMPYRIEDEARKLGANFATAPAFRPHVVRDGQLITGQQQYSARLAALQVIEALGH